MNTLQLLASDRGLLQQARYFTYFRKFENINDTKYVIRFHQKEDISSNFLIISQSLVPQLSCNFQLTLFYYKSFISDSLFPATVRLHPARRPFESSSCLRSATIGYRRCNVEEVRLVIHKFHRLSSGGIFYYNLFAYRILLIRNDIFLKS